MDILEKLENSYNREVQKKVLAQLDIIDAATEKYHQENIIPFNLPGTSQTASRPVATRKALHKNYKSELRNQIHKVKFEYKGKMDEIRKTTILTLKKQTIARFD